MYIFSNSLRPINLRPAFLVATLASLFTFGNPAQATDSTWQGTPNGTSDFSTASKWSGGLPENDRGDYIYFNNTGTPGYVSDTSDSDVNWSALNFTGDNGGGYTIGLERWQLYSANRTFVVVSSGVTNNETISFNRGGNRFLLLFGGNNTILNNGSGLLTLRYSDAAIRVVTGETAAANLIVNGTGDTSIALQIQGLSDGGTIAREVTLTKSGSGMLTLTGANTYTGATTINGGTLALSGSGSIGSSTTITVGGGAVFDVSNTGFTLARTLAGNGTVYGATTLGGTLSPGISDPGAITFSGSATLSVGGQYMWEVGTVSSDGGLQGLAGVNFDQMIVTGAGGTLTLNSSGSYNISISAPGAVANWNPHKSYQWNIATANSIAGTGTLSLNTGRFTGNNTLGGGSFTIASGGGTLQLIFNGSTAPANAYWAVAGSGAWNAVSPNWSYSAGGTPPTGMFAADDDAVFSATAAGTGSFNVTVDAGGIVANSISVNTGVTPTIDGGTITLGNGGTTSLTGIISVSTAATFTSSISTAGGVGLTKAGAGVLALNAANSFAGGATILAGTVAIGNNNALDTGTLTFSGAGTLRAGAATLALGNTTLTLNATATVDTFANMLTISGVIGGTGNLTKTGAGTLILSGANTYTGGTTLSSGILNINNCLNLGTFTTGTTGTLTFNGGTLQFGASGITLDALRSVVITASGGYVDTSLFDGTIAGTLRGGGGLTKVGTGALTLTGANTYTGATTINGGTLALSGSGSIGSSATITVGGGAVFDVSNTGFTLAKTLAGNGTVYGATTLGGTLSPGISGPGTITFSGSATLSAGGRYLWEVGTVSSDGGLQGLAGVNFDQMLVTGAGGTLTLNSGSYNISISAPGAVANWNPHKSYQWIIATANSIAGTGTLSLNTGGFTGNNTLGGGSFTIASGGGTLQLIFNGSTAPANAYWAVAGSGAWNAVSPNWSYSAGGTPPTGMFAADDDAVFSATAAGTGSFNVTVDAGGIVANSISVNTGVTPTIDGGTITLGNGGTTSLTGIISVSTAATFTSSISTASGVGLTKAGAGVLALNAANSFAGGATISAGTVAIGNNNALDTGTLTFSGAGTLRAGAATLALGNTTLTLNAAATVDTFANMLTISGVIGGTGNLTKTGAGTLILSGANTYTGSTTITGGTLTIGADNTLWQSGALTFGDSSSATGNLDLNNFSQTIGSLAVRSDSATANTIVIGSGKTLAVNGAGGLTVGFDNGGTSATTRKLTISGSGSLVVDNAAANVTVGVSQNSATYNDSGTLDLSTLSSVTLGNATTAISQLLVGYGTYAGGQLTLSGTANTIYATTVRVGDTGTFNTVPGVASTLVLGEGSNVIAGDTINIGNAKATGTLKFTTQTQGSPGSVTIGGRTSGTTTFNIGYNNTINTALSPAGTLDLRGHNAYITAGSVTVGFANNTNTTGPGGAAGTFSFDGGTFTITTLTLGSKSGTAGTGTANGTFFMGGGSGMIDAATLSTSSISVGKANGTLTLAGGTLTMNGNIAKGASTGAGTATFKLGAATLVAGNSFSITSGVVMTLTGNGTLQSDSTKTMAIASVIGDGGSGYGIAKTGGGTLTLSRANTYTGGTTINSGTLTMGNASALGTISSGGNTGSVTFTGAATLVVNQTGTIGALTGVSGSTITAGSGAGAVTLTSSGTGTANTTFSGMIQDAGSNGTLSFVKTGTGILTLSGANTHTGGTTLSGGILNIINGLNLGTYTTGTTGTLTFNGGTLRFGASGITLDALRSVVITASGGYVNTSLFDGTIAGIVSGGGGLTKVGTGTLTLTGANTYTGGTTLSGGILNINNSLNLGTYTTGATGTLTFNGGTLQFGTSGITLNALRSVVITASGGYVDTSLFDGTIAGIVSGGGGLTKVGTGALTLTGTNTYTGATTINGGTLALSGSGSIGSSTTITVGGGAVFDVSSTGFTLARTLAGNGTVYGATTLGGTLSPGISGPGAITFSGSATLSAGGQYLWEVGTVSSDGGLQGSAGVNFDQMLVTGAGGTLTLNSGSYNISISAPGAVANWNPHKSYQWIIATANSIAGTGTLSLDTGGFTGNNTLGGGSFTIASGGGTLQLIFNGSTAPGNAYWAVAESGAWNAVSPNWSYNANGISTGTFTTDDDAVFSATSAGAGSLNVTVDSGGIVANSISVNTGVTPTIDGGTITLGNGGTTSLTGIISVSTAATFTSSISTASGVGLTKAGAGVLALNAANSFAGGATISAGTVAIGNNNALDTGTLTFSGAGTLRVGAATLALGNTTLTLNAAATVDTFANMLTISGVIGGSGNLTKTGAGTLILSGPNTYTGGTTINGGTLALSGDNRLNIAGTLSFSANSTFDVRTSSQTLANVTVSDNFTGTVVGGGTLSLGANSLAVGNTSLGTSALDLSGLSTFVFNNAANTVTVGGLNNSGSSSAGVLTLAANTTITAGSLNVQTVISGGTISFNTGTLNLGLNTVINADSINIGTSNRDNGTVQYGSSKTKPTLKIRGTTGLDTARANITIGQHYSGWGTAITAKIDLTSNATGGTLDAKVGTLSVGNYTRGPNNETASFLMGAGTLDATAITLGTMSDNNGENGTTLTSVFSVSGGTVKVQTLTLGTHTDAYDSLVSTFTLTSGAVLNAQTITAGAGTATRTFTWNDGTIANYDASTDLLISSGLTTLNLATAGLHAFDVGSGRQGTVSQIMSGSGALTKTGSGTLTLTAANTYTGGTTINGGVLMADNATGSATGIGGAVRVTNSCTLGGVGTIGGLVVVSDGGLVVPGDYDGQGMLTLEQGILFTLGGGISVTLRGSTPNLKVTGGTVDLSSGKLSVRVGSGFQEVFTPLWIINNTTGSAIQGTFDGLPEGALVYGGDRVFRIYYSANYNTGELTGGNDVALVYVATQGTIITVR